jgi:hypothetical protein
MELFLVVKPSSHKNNNKTHLRAIKKFHQILLISFFSPPLNFDLFCFGQNFIRSFIT